jgi:hypothetical protein
VLQQELERLKEVSLQRERERLKEESCKESLRG